MRTAFALVLTALATMESTPPAEPPGTARRAVLVELFTSEGCSSCPPADALLARLAADAELRERVVPLAFHVDYWDRLGWRDPYSDRRFTGRQEEYARRRFGSDSIYTPQAVVAGESECVGSDDRRLTYLIDLASAGPPAVDLTILSAARDAERIAVAFDVRRRPGTQPSEQEIWLAITESGLRIAVRRGENAGRTLAHERVVRRLTRVGTLRADERRRRFELAPAIDFEVTGELGAAIFAQDPRTLAVATAAWVDLSR